MVARAGLALIPLSVLALSSVVIAGGPPRPVGAYGGHSLGRDIFVLDVSIPALLRFDRSTLTRSQTVLSGADAALDPYGVALPGDGTVWTLGDKGRLLFRFSETTGELVERRRLGAPCQGIAAFWDRVALIAIRLRPNEPLLLREGERPPRPWTTIVSRPARDPMSGLIANLLRCGSGTTGAVPCWFLAGRPEVLLVSRDGSLRAVEVPSFAPAAERISRAADPGSGFAYPVRDVLSTAEGLWVLSNQEGDRTPVEEGALRGLHVALVRPGGAVRVFALDREARAIVDADARGVVVLFADGFIARVPRR